jgi:hypothetical protein
LSPTSMALALAQPSIRTSAMHAIAPVKLNLIAYLLSITSRLVGIFILRACREDKNSVSLEAYSFIL